MQKSYIDMTNSDIGDKQKKLVFRGKWQ